MGIKPLNKRERIYEGKAKRLYATDKEGYLVQEFRDDLFDLGRPRLREDDGVHLRHVHDLGPERLPQGADGLERHHLERVVLVLEGVVQLQEHVVERHRVRYGVLADVGLGFERLDVGERLFLQFLDLAGVVLSAAGLARYEAALADFPLCCRLLAPVLPITVPRYVSQNSISYSPSASPITMTSSSPFGGLDAPPSTIATS